MTVYIVFEVYIEDSEWIVAVFDSLEKAKAHIDGERGDFRIDEWEVL